jgi:hypothetical protein
MPSHASAPSFVAMCQNYLMTQSVAFLLPHYSYSTFVCWVGNEEKLNSKGDEKKDSWLLYASHNIGGIL